MPDRNDHTAYPKARSEQEVTADQDDTVDGKERLLGDLPPLGSGRPRSPDPQTAFSVGEVPIEIGGLLWAESRDLRPILILDRYADSLVGYDVVAGEYVSYGVKSLGRDLSGSEGRTIYYETQSGDVELPPGEDLPEDELTRL